MNKAIPERRRRVIFELVTRKDDLELNDQKGFQHRQKNVFFQHILFFIYKEASRIRELTCSRNLFENVLIK